MLLSIIWDFDPAIIKLGSLEVRYYGLLWATSFFLGYLIVKKIFLLEGKSEKLLDPLLYAILIGAVLGARLGHVFFYDWDYYSEHTNEILKIWEGGLASHGGAIGVLLGLWWFSKYKLKGSFLYLVDRIVIVAALSAFCIRLGNFLNSEIVGIPTEVPWGVVFVRIGDGVAGIARHPAQLYEAICYLFIFIGLYFSYFKTDMFKKPGKAFGVFLISIFTVRFFVEFVKNSQGGIESVIDGALSSGQLLSIPFIIVGLYFLFRKTPAIS
jgi:prolipoprotein diacylglyceryl transferase